MMTDTIAIPSIVPLPLWRRILTLLSYGTGVVRRGWAMFHRRELLGFAVLAAFGLALSGCTKRESFSYRMTVEVETPQGLRTGSSVIKLSVSDPGRGPFVLPHSGTNAQSRGEAVAVDLPDGQVLFALLRKPDSSNGAEVFPYEALNPPRHTGEYALINRTRELKRMTNIGTLPREHWLMLVRFRDIGDPTSVELVDPDDPAASFGEGVSIRRITIQITDDRVTTGIEKRLGWLSHHPEPGVKPNLSPTDFSIEASLRHGDFRRL